MSLPHIDTLIIGQGLAGSALAWFLTAAGERVSVFDDGHVSASSVVAAGLVNPLAGLRFTRRPELDDWLVAADAWYAGLESRFASRFFHPLPMLRLFRSVEQRRFFERLLDDPRNHTLLDGAFGPEDCPEPIAAPFGGFVQRRTGYVDLPLLLDTLRQWLQDQGALHECTLNLHDVRWEADAVTAAGLTARRLVLCDGARLHGNPWFDGLPLRPEKGEILNLQTPWRPRHIINGAYWMVPAHDGGLRLGATHEHHAIDRRPTADGRRELLAAFAALRPADHAPEVLAHRVGIRPGTADRYPLIGRHPHMPQLWVFNGFGARGSLVIPWYARRLTAHLTRGEALPIEADIRRCG